MSKPCESLPRLPVAKMNEGVAPGRAQYENWRAGAQSAYELIALDGPKAFRGTGTAYPLLDVVATQTAVTGGLYRRERRHVESSGRVFWLHRHLRGAERVQAGAETYTMEAGTLVLRDTGRPFVSHSGYVERQTLVIPVHHIETADDFGNTVNHCSFSTSTPQGQLLEDAMGRLFDALPTCAVHEAAAQHGAFLELLNGLLAKRPNKAQSRRIREAQFASMKQYLQQRLGDPGVGV